MGKRIWIVLVWVVSIVIWSIALAQSVWFKDVKDAPFDAWNNLEQGDQATDIGQVFDKDAISPNDSVSERIQKFLKVNYSNTEQRATFYIKNAFNWFLAIVGMVSLIVVIVWFYQMLTADGSEEKFKEARKYVIGALIALVVIGLAWFVVSRVFEIFEKTRDAV